MARARTAAAHRKAAVHRNPARRGRPKGGSIAGLLKKKKAQRKAHGRSQRR